MNWLRENAFLATWLALPVALLVGFFQAKKANFANVDWTRFMMYFGFLTSLAVVFTPKFDQHSRSYAEFLATFLIGSIIVSRKQ